VLSFYQAGNASGCHQFGPGGFFGKQAESGSAEKHGRRFSLD
jgi:hypothetical protein